MAKTLIVAQRVKELCEKDGKKLSVSADLADKLTAKVESMINEACSRALANGRTTVMPKDI